MGKDRREALKTLTLESSILPTEHDVIVDGGGLQGVAIIRYIISQPATPPHGNLSVSCQKFEDRTGRLRGAGLRHRPWTAERRTGK
jgi:hypothetical protein